MKRTVIIASIVAFLLALFLPQNIAFADGTKYCVIFDATPVYASASDSATILGELQGRDEIDVSGSETNSSGTYYSFLYNNTTAYIKSDFVYEARGSAEYSVSYAKATRTSSSEVINVYSRPQTDSEVLEVCSDGTVIDMVTAYNDDFYAVNVDGKIGYVKSENITTGVTYYQRIALIVGAVVLAGVLGIVLIQSVSIGKNGKKHTSGATASFE